MSCDETLQMFERDPDQSGAPTGCTAYILRAWGVIYDGIVSEVRVTDGLPHLRYISGTGTRRARFPDETSRVFVRNDAPIDESVFQIAAPRKLEVVPTSLSDIKWEWD